MIFSFRTFKKIPMMFAQIFIIAYEKNIDIEPKPFWNSHYLILHGCSLNFLQKKLSQIVRQRLGEHIKDLKSIEV